MSHGSIIRGSFPLYTNLLKNPSIPSTLRTVGAKQWSPSSICFNCRIQAAAVAHLRRSFTTSHSRPARIQPIGRKSSAQPQPVSSAGGRNSGGPVKPAAAPVESRSKIAVSRREALRIFGDKLPFQDAQDVLQQIHNLRVDGSLAIEGFSELNLPSSAPVHEAQLLEGLDYLRAQYPLDEEANRESYLQRQIEIAEKSLLARAQSLKLYKKSEGDEDAAGSYNAGLSAVDRGSVLVQRRLAREAEIKAEKEADEKAIAEGGEAAAKVAAKEKNRQLVLPWNNAELTPEQHKRNEYIEKLRLEAELDPQKILATRSAASRLLQPTIFALVAGGLAYLFAEFYIPPSKDSRMWPNTSPALSTCIGIAILNAAVFVAWRRPELWKMLNRNFLLAAGHPRPVSMIGNLFSHQQFGHFGVNMVALMLIGPTVHEEIGRGNFLALFMISGFAGSLANLYWNVLTRNLTTASLGASGCLYGLLGAFFVLKEHLALKIPFSNISLEYSAETGLVVLLGLELLAFWRYKGQGGIDHTSHIGGLLAGLLYARILKARAEASAKAKRAQREGSITALTE